jgi:hypothetical protein
LKETYQIAILAKDTFFPDGNFVHAFLYYDPENHVSLGGKTRIITVELVKTKPIADKPVENMTNAELWAVFFEYLTNKEKRSKILQIIKREEGIAMALDTLVNITQEEREYAYQSSLLKGEMDWNTDIQDAKYEAALDIARNALAQGASPEFVQKITGLDMQTITRL